MFSYFGGEQKEGSTPDAEQPQNSLQAIDAAEKARLITSIDSNKYPRRAGGWNFRRDLGPREYIARAVTLMLLFAIAFFVKPHTPRSREDHEWLVEFSLVMLIWYTAVHALAYIPG